MSKKVRSSTMNPETLARLRRISTATLTTAMFKRGFRNIFMQGVRLLGTLDTNMVGPASTLRYIPAREDLDTIGVFADPNHPQRRAVETAKAGHVLVMDCRGEILMTRLMVRGAAGLVTDGGLRDSAPIAAMDFPTFCAGPSAPLNLAAHHAVEIDSPIGCGGVAVYPGDIIVGDADGVVVLPAALADDVAAEAAAQEDMEAFLLARVAAGASLRGTYPPDETTRTAYEVWKAAGKP
jgi:regulator of RNase E activity RraA